MNQSAVHYTCIDIASTDKITGVKLGHRQFFLQLVTFVCTTFIYLFIWYNYNATKKLDMKWNLCLWCGVLLHQIFMQEKSNEKMCQKQVIWKRKRATTFLICMLHFRIFTNFWKIDSILLKSSAVSLWISKNGEVHFTSEYSWCSWLLSFKSNLNIWGFKFVFSQWSMVSCL